MTTSEKTTITVQTLIQRPVEQVWTLWTTPAHIMHWNHASDDWHTPQADNDLRAGGRFLFRMEAKDGSAGFDFSGTYHEVTPNRKIACILDDGRSVQVSFTRQGDRTILTETFEAEQINSVALQRQGWQAILDNFRKYAEEEEPGSTPVG